MVFVRYLTFWGSKCPDGTYGGVRYAILLSKFNKTLCYVVQNGSTGTKPHIALLSDEV